VSIDLLIILFTYFYSFRHIIYDILKHKLYFIYLFVFNLVAFITTTSRGIVHMKTFPSNHILTDPVKRSIIDQILIDLKMNLTSYMSLLTNCIIKDKQILTTNGKQILFLPEHKFLYENLKQKYPERDLNGTYFF